MRYLKVIWWIPREQKRRRLIASLQLRRTIGQSSRQLHRRWSDVEATIEAEVLEYLDKVWPGVVETPVLTHTVAQEANMFAGRKPA
jgi:hypothetical protein